MLWPNNSSSEDKFLTRVRFLFLPSPRNSLTMVKLKSGICARTETSRLRKASHHA